jgi:magnesium transporter
MTIQSDTILIKKFLSDHPKEAVRLIEQQKDEEIAALLDALPDSISARVIAHMNMLNSINCLQIMTIPKVVAILENLALELVSALIRNISVNVQKEILESMTKEKSIFLNKTLTYPEGTVGSIMDPLVYTFFEDISVSNALKLWKNHAELNENYVYTVTRDHKIAGVLNLYELLRLKSDQLLGTVINRKVSKLFADVKLTLIQNHPGWQEQLVLPVVDDNNIIQGVLRYKILRRFEESRVKRVLPRHLMKTSSALGELYRLGITSLIQGAATLYNQHEKK